jgi:hypothetical protein
MSGQAQRHQELVAQSLAGIKRRQRPIIPDRGETDTSGIEILAGDHPALFQRHALLPQ